MHVLLKAATQTACASAHLGVALLFAVAIAVLILSLAPLVRLHCTLLMGAAGGAKLPAAEKMTVA
jgi:hypothetical protein